MENSILHGIMNKPSKEGFILIEAMIEDGNIKITIQDNGIGMPDETLKSLNGDNYGYRDGGYGIKNVRKRILLNYGEQFRIRFKSIPKEGTIAELVIPAKYAEI